MGTVNQAGCAGVLAEVSGLSSGRPSPLLLRLFPSSSEAAAVHAPFFSLMDSAITAVFWLVLLPVFPFLGIFLLFAVGLWTLSMLTPF